MLRLQVVAEGVLGALLLCLEDEATSSSGHPPVCMKLQTSAQSKFFEKSCHIIKDFQAWLVFQSLTIPLRE